MATGFDPFEGMVPPTGSMYPIDHEQLELASRLLLLGARHEVRALPSGRSQLVASNNPESLAQAIDNLSSDRAFYFTINPLATTPKKAATDKDIERRDWLFFDLDPIRPPDTSATEAEKAAALRLASLVEQWAVKNGWPAPYIVDSGNGIYLLYRINLPNDPITRQLIAAITKHIAKLFALESGVKVDTAVSNASRIVRIPGTWNVKGSNTPDRPHRQCKFLHIPYAAHVLTLAQIQAAVEPQAEPKAEQATDEQDPFAKTGNTSNRVRAWLRRAMESELVALALTPPGERNNGLNKAAFNLGQLIPVGLLKIDAVRALNVIGAQLGLSKTEVEKTVASGITAGMASPRVLPEWAQEEQAHQSEEAHTEKPLAAKTIGAHEVEPEDVHWLWHMRIPIGFITLFAGQTGQGKSAVTLDIAAKLSKGEALPDCPGDGIKRRTLIISEDPIAHMLVPRLMAAGADRTQIRFMTLEAMQQWTLNKIDFLKEACDESGHPSLIVIDPPTNWLSARDEHKNSEVRQILMKLASWLPEANAACVMITHLNKPSAGKSSDAISRIVGSVAWATVCRVACQFFPNPDEPHQSLMAVAKNNLGPKAATLGYTIENSDGMPKLTWQGEVDISAEQANSGESRKIKKMEATEFLEELFREKRSWPSQEIMDLADGKDVKRTNLFAAKKSLRIKAVRVADEQNPGKQAWYWDAPPGWPPRLEATDEQHVDDKPAF